MKIFGFGLLPNNKIYYRKFGVKKKTNYIFFKFVSKVLVSNYFRQNDFYQVTNNFITNISYKIIFFPQRYVSYFFQFISKLSLRFFFSLSYFSNF